MRQLTDLTGVGPSSVQKLHRLGIFSVEDLILHYPRRYEDYSTVMQISTLQPGNVTIKGKVETIRARYVRRGLHITEAQFVDDSGSIKVIWFNQPYRQKHLKKGVLYYVSGVLEFKNQQYALLNPSVEKAASLAVNTARILPVYPETKGLTSKQIRKMMQAVKSDFGSVMSDLPLEIEQELTLMSFTEALEKLHFPETTHDIELARHRIAIGETFGLVLAGLLNKQQNAAEAGIAIPFDEKLAQRFSKELPFKLTDAQRKAAWMIIKDLESPTPMNRLLEGDVGSGKTVVAALACLGVIRSGYQVAIMVPTEILAQQHYQTFKQLLLPYDIAIDLIVSKQKAAEKKQALQRIEQGEAHVVVGTHAVIQEAVGFAKLGLVIIDEQHRFGVVQRQTLLKKADTVPHILSMSATPIPRTLALTLYGELDITVIDALPPGRKATRTQVVSPNSKQSMYKKIHEEIIAGRQVFIVYPLIEESETVVATSAEQAFDTLTKTELKGKRVGLLHGKMKPEVKETIMQQMVFGELDVLISTTVIEVGVDVPNASVMVIEGADRFGLAQIHQLRGRVGRSTHQAYCYLVPSTSQPVSKRLKAAEQTNNGFELAELDLEIRGPGAIYGTRQSGALDLKIATLMDGRTIAQAQQAAQLFVDKGLDLLQYPTIKQRVDGLRAITNLN